MQITLTFDTILEMREWLEWVRVVGPAQKHAPSQGASIGELEFTIRTENCLKAEGIETVEQLCSWSETGLLKTPNLGRKSLNEIKEVLGSRGLALSP